ncbi:hypothetical protein HF690_04375 [Oleiagrimonas citrea]|uniref:Uncharacterized protein n=1 Tax=Oleiagrimonas citrea TaxID=1665687 RepID=A0A846ZKT8_9GAMM|nr:hypothetical protein [Oleiagrimonas citrea]NKZ38189.1 hypothetical protein [Oleiagrimonas citrea]
MNPAGAGEMVSGTVLLHCEAHFIEDAGHMLLGSEEVSAQMMERIASLAD